MRMRGTISLNIHNLLRIYKRSCSTPQDNNFPIYLLNKLLKRKVLLLLRMRRSISLSMHNLLRIY